MSKFIIRESNNKIITSIHMSERTRILLKEISSQPTSCLQSPSPEVSWTKLFYSHLGTIKEIFSFHMLWNQNPSKSVLFHTRTWLLLFREIQGEISMDMRLKLSQFLDVWVLEDNTVFKSMMNVCRYHCKCVWNLYWVVRNASVVDLNFPK